MVFDLTIRVYIPKHTNLGYFVYEVVVKIVKNNLNMDIESILKVL